jgi:hypothetical protein
MMSEESEWFAPKRYGYGAGLPISWQGWTVMLAYIAIVGVVAARYGDKPLVALAIVIPLTTVLLVITARTTRGGWRWRWGEED